MDEKEKIAQVLADASVAITKLAAERDTLKTANVQLTEERDNIILRLKSEKLAADMFEKGLDGGRDFATVVDEVEKAAQAGDLPVYEKAVKMASRDMSQGFQINHDEVKSGPGNSELEQYIVG